MAVKHVLNLLPVAAKFIYPTSHHLANLFCAKNAVVQAGSGWIWPLFNVFWGSLHEDDEVLLCLC